MTTKNEILAHSSGLVRFTYTASATQYFRATNKVRGGMRRDERFPMGILKRSEVVCSVALDGSYEREVMASALRQGVAMESVRDLVEFTARGLSGFTWVDGAEGLLVANAEGALALRAYPASGIDHYGSVSTYIDASNGSVLSEADLEPWRGAPRHFYPLVINGVTMTREDGTPIYKVVPHYYYLSGMSDYRAD